jgi:hypothetical protein
VSCRELSCRTLTVEADHANLHFATPPERVDVAATACVLALPGGPYAVTAPPDALIEVEQEASSGHRITITGAQARVLASTAPLSLRGDTPGESAAGG